MKHSLKEENKKEAFLMNLFFLFFWDANPNHYCSCCGKYLGTKCNKMFIDHLLEKSDYPEIKYAVTNCTLVCEDHHVSKRTNKQHPALTLQIEKLEDLYENKREELIAESNQVREMLIKTAELLEYDKTRLSHGEL